MRWLRNTLLSAAIGCFAATASAQAPMGSTKSTPGVTLGTPRPIGAFRPASTSDGLTPRVVRAARPLQEEPWSLFWPSRTGGYLPEAEELPTRPAVEPRYPIDAPKRPPAAEPRYPMKVDGKNPTSDGGTNSMLQVTQELFTFKPKKAEVATPSTLPSSSPAQSPSQAPALDLNQNNTLVFGPLWTNRFYVRGEALLWTARGFRVPPLVTTASPADPELTRGALGFGSTTVLLGDTRLAGGFRPGARVTAGWNCDPCGVWSVEGSFFFLSRRDTDSNFTSDQSPVLARPFFNVNTGMQDRNLATTPLNGVFASTGSIRVDASSELWGAELNARRLLCFGDCFGDCFRVTGIVGFRYLDLQDRLSVVEDVNVITSPPPFAPGLRGTITDEFATSNRFYGGQVGIDSEWRRGKWTVEGRAKVALGATCQTVDIDGRQRLVFPGGNVQNFSGGLFALSSNIGHHRQTRFAVVPEVGFKVGYDLTSNVRVFAGYDFLYWSSVLRAGEQTDPGLDANLIPNSGAPFPPANQVRPRVPFQTSGYWAHGASVGFEIRY